VQQQQHRNPAGTAQPQPGRSSSQSSMTGHSRGGLSYQPNINAAVNQISERLRAHRGFNESSDPNDADQFLLANIAATIGPRGVAPDMESLSGRSQRSHRSHNPVQIAVLRVVPMAVLPVTLVAIALGPIKPIGQRCRTCQRRAKAWLLTCFVLRHNWHRYQSSRSWLRLFSPRSLCPLTLSTIYLPQQVT
jgi:hypothetical protein